MNKFCNGFWSGAVLGVCLGVILGVVMGGSFSLLETMPAWEHAPIVEPPLPHWFDRYVKSIDWINILKIIGLYLLVSAIGAIAIGKFIAAGSKDDDEQR